MSVRVLSSATLLTLALAVAGAVVLAGAQVTGNAMPRVAPAVDTADGRSTAPAPETYTGTYVQATGQDSSTSSNPMQSDPDSYAPGAGSPATETRSAADEAAPAQAPASQPGPAIAPSRFLDADPNSPAAQLSGPGPHFKMKPGADR